MSVQNLTGLQGEWANVAADGFDPSRHPEVLTPEAAHAVMESARTQEVRERLLAEDRWQERYGGRSEGRRDRDEILDFMIVTDNQVFSEAYHEFEQEADDLQRELDRAFDSFEKAQKALDQQEKELLSRSIVLSDGRIIGVGADGYYYDRDGDRLTGDDHEEARRLHDARPNATTTDEWEQFDHDKDTLNGIEERLKEQQRRLDEMRAQAEEIRDDLENNPHMRAEQRQEAITELERLQEEIKDMRPGIRDLHQQIDQVTDSDIEAYKRSGPSSTNDNQGVQTDVQLAGDFEQAATGAEPEEIVDAPAPVTQASPKPDIFAF